MLAPKLVQSYRENADPIFDAVDADKNGVISWNEYKTFIMSLGATEADAHVGFGNIDTNGDGMLSYEEFSYAGVMYAMDRYDSRYKHFYGKWRENGNE